MVSREKYRRVRLPRAIGRILDDKIAADCSAGADDPYCPLDKEISVA
jgi:hypothetical protein